MNIILYTLADSLPIHITDRAARVLCQGLRLYPEGAPEGPFQFLLNALQIIANVEVKGKPIALPLRRDGAVQIVANALTSLLPSEVKFRAMVKGFSKFCRGQETIDVFSSFELDKTVAKPKSQPIVLDLC